MITPPLTIERLLEGLGPATAFRDAIIGDLAEEFRQRAERHGLSAARRWYCREAVRVSPHLLLAWLRGLQPSDVGHLANVLLPSWLISVMVSFFVLLTGTSVLGILGYSAKTATHSPISQLVVAIGLVAMAIGAAAGGAVASSLHGHARFAAALGFGAVYAVAHFSLSLVGPHVISATGWATELAILLGALIGGLLHARSRALTLAQRPFDDQP